MGITPEQKYHYAQSASFSTSQKSNNLKMIEKPSYSISTRFVFLSLSF